MNFNIETKPVSEWKVGCAKCHSPGSTYVARPSQTNIINPARLHSVQATGVCMQCPSQGQPTTNPINEKYYDWPVHFEVGMDLRNFWKLEEHKLGEQTFTHFADGSSHKNRMQGNDYIQSAMYSPGVSCNSCHDSHGTLNNADLLKPAHTLCLECHGLKSPDGPRGATVEEHTHHAKGSTGNECVGCHMPKIAQQIADLNVRSHTFRFSHPAKPKP